MILDPLKDFANCCTFKGAKPLFCFSLYDTIFRPRVSVSRMLQPDSKVLHELVCLQEAIFENKRPGRMRELQQAVSSPRTAALYLAFHHHRVCGFILLKRSCRGRLWCIRGIGVSRPYRRLGIGTLLLGQAVTLMKRLHADALVSYVNRHNSTSLHLHKRLGFRLDQVSHPASSQLNHRLIFYP